MKNEMMEKYQEFCAGCGHRVAMHIIDDVINEMCINEKIIMALDVACCSLFIDNICYDSIMCPHGRVIPISVGMKSIRKNNIIMGYMGDGAAYSIGLNELMHSAIRNDHVLNIIINNNIFAMTGGQMSPTSLDGQRTISSINGKDVLKYGKPFKIENVLKNFDIKYLARVALTTNKYVDDMKNILKEAIECYQNEKGFCLIEVISPCPTNMHMNVKECYDYVNNVVLNEYNLGVFKK